MILVSILALLLVFLLAFLVPKKIKPLIFILALILLVLLYFYWALFVPKEDVSERIYRTLKEQEKRADLSFKEVTFKEVVGEIKYWELTAKSAMVNKSTGIATLKESEGTFFKEGKAVLRFRSPAALWDMKKKEIHLDKPLGFDISLERKISTLLATLKKSRFSVFNLPKLYSKEAGYWFKANNLSWQLTNQKLICSGGILLNKGEVTGYSERLEGDVGLERVVLEGKPKVVIAPDGVSPITLEATRFEVVSPEDTIYARGNPKIFWKDAEVLADSMKYLQRGRFLDLSGRVKIDYKDIQAWGDTAQYFTEEEKVILAGNARAVQGENELSGERVNVSLKDKKISVIGKGKVIITEEELK